MDDLDADSGDNAPAQRVDTGVGSDVVTITAPAHTLNWALLGLVVVGVWWVYSQWDAGTEYDDED